MLDQEIICDSPFPNKMIIDLEMFHLGMKHWIGSKGDSRDILKS
jgi:hypothetical protein